MSAFSEAPLGHGLQPYCGSPPSPDGWAPRWNGNPLIRFLLERLKDRRRRHGQQDRSARMGVLAGGVEYRAAWPEQDRTAMGRHSKH